MPTVTPKENFLMCLYGEQPEWVPQNTMGKMPGDEVDPPNCWFTPMILNDHRFGGAETDHWGIKYAANYETGMAMMPDTHYHALEDITQWRDVIKARDLSKVDWQAQYDDAPELREIDRSQTCITFNTHLGYFQNLMGLMGFEDGMCAMFEEPEETKALLEYMTDFYCEVLEKMWDIVKPDCLLITDDTATEMAPFVSLEMYEEFLLPCYRRHAQIANDTGVPIIFHNCGKSEIFIEDMRSFGVKMWDSVQTCNDLDGIQAKYGNSLVLAGCNEISRDCGPDATDEEIRQAVRDIIDHYAPGGGYMFIGGFTGPLDDESIAHKNKVMFDEVDRYGHIFYKQ